MPDPLSISIDVSKVTAAATTYSSAMQQIIASTQRANEAVIGFQRVLHTIGRVSTQSVDAWATSLGNLASNARRAERAVGALSAKLNGAATASGASGQQTARQLSAIAAATKAADAVVAARSRVAAATSAAGAVVAARPRAAQGISNLESIKLATAAAGDLQKALSAAGATSTLGVADWTKNLRSLRDAARGASTAIGSLSTKMEAISKNTAGIGALKQISGALGAINANAGAAAQVAAGISAATAAAGRRRTTLPAVVAPTGGAAQNINQLQRQLQQVAPAAGAASRAMQGFSSAALTAASGSRRLFASLGILGGGFLALRVIRSTAQAMAEFELNMKRIGVVASQLGRGGLEELRQSSIKIGTTTIFSANQAAEGYLKLAKAGVATARDLQAALIPSLNFAAANSLDLEQATQILIQSLTQFQIPVQNAADVADALTSAANATLTEVDALAKGLVFAGPIAAVSATKFEELVTILAALSQAGQDASIAGTAVRGVMTALADPTEEARLKIEGLGLDLENIKPSANSLLEIFVEFRKAVQRFGKEGFADVAAGIFENRTIAAAVALTAQLSGEITRTADAMERGRGISASFSATISDTLSGSFRRLTNTIEAAQITAGDAGLLGVFRKLTDATTLLVGRLAGFEGAFNGLDEGTRSVSRLIEFFGTLILTIGSLGVAIRLLNGVILGLKLSNPFTAVLVAISSAAAGILTFREELITIDGTTQTLGQTFSDVFGFIRDIALGVFADIKRNVDELNAAIDKLRGRSAAQQAGAQNELLAGASQRLLDTPVSRQAAEDFISELEERAKLQEDVTQRANELYKRSAAAQNSGRVAQAQALQIEADRLVLKKNRLKALQALRLQNAVLIDSEGPATKLGPAVLDAFGFFETLKVKTPAERRAERAAESLIPRGPSDEQRAALGAVAVGEELAQGLSDQQRAITGAKRATTEHIEEFGRLSLATKENAILIKLEERALAALKNGITVTSEQRALGLQLLTLEAQGLAELDAEQARAIGLAVEQAQRLGSLRKENDLYNESLRKTEEQQRKVNEGISDTRFDLQNKLRLTNVPEPRRDLERQRLELLRNATPEQTIKINAEFAPGGDLDRANTALKIFEQIERIAGGIGDALGTAIADFVTGAGEAKDIFLSLANDITRILAKELIAQPIADVVKRGITDVGSQFIPGLKRAQQELGSVENTNVSIGNFGTQVDNASASVSFFSDILRGFTFEGKPISTVAAPTIAPSAGPQATVPGAVPIQIGPGRVIGAPLGAAVPQAAPQTVETDVVLQDFTQNLEAANARVGPDMFVELQRTPAAAQALNDSSLAAARANQELASSSTAMAQSLSAVQSAAQEAQPLPQGVDLPSAAPVPGVSPAQPEQSNLQTLSQLSAIGAGISGLGLLLGSIFGASSETTQILGSIFGVMTAVLVTLQIISSIQSFLATKEAADTFAEPVAEAAVTGAVVAAGSAAGNTALASAAPLLAAAATGFVEAAPQFLFASFGFNALALASVALGEAGIALGGAGVLLNSAGGFLVASAAAWAPLIPPLLEAANALLAAAVILAGIGLVALLTAQHGAVVTKPTLTLLGEAGPEAVVPLAQGPQGLGIRNYVATREQQVSGSSAPAQHGPEVAIPIARLAGGHLGVHRVGGGGQEQQRGGPGRPVNITILTPDANSFRRSQGQVMNDIRRGIRGR